MGETPTGPLRRTRRGLWLCSPEPMLKLLYSSYVNHESSCQQSRPKSPFTKHGAVTFKGW